jgi:membrane protease YdiL (CAAX protease family)
MVFMAAYLAHALYANRNRDMPTANNSSPIYAVLQFPLILLAYYYGFIYDVFNRDLVFLPMFVLGLLGGHLLFGLSLLATHQNLRDTLAQLADVSGFWGFIKRNPEIIIRFAAVSFAEELIYRVAAQNILLEWTGRPLLAIGLVAIAFGVVHWHFFRNPPVQSLEFMAFSVLLGAIFYITGSLLFVATLHTIRNLNIVYVEFLVKQEELGDEEKAQEALDTMYRHRKTKPA